MVLAFSRDAEERRVWVCSTPAKNIEWVRVVLSVVTLGGVVLALADPGRAWTVAQSVGVGEVPFTILSAVAVLDFDRAQPWHWVQVPAALLTLVIFFALDGLRKRLDAGGAVDMQGRRVWLLILVFRVREVLGLIWIAMVLWYVPDLVRILHQGCQLIGVTESLAARVFGPADCPIAPGA